MPEEGRVRPAGADQVEQRVHELLDALVQQPRALLAGDGVDQADGLGAALGDVLVLELLRPRQPEALVEVAARLGHVDVGRGRQNDTEPAAGNVGEADMVAVEMAARDEEDAVRLVGEARRRGQPVEHAVEEGRVEAERERPPPRDEEVGAHGVPHRRRDGAEQRGRVLVADRRLRTLGGGVELTEEDRLVHGARRVEAGDQKVGHRQCEPAFLGTVEALVNADAREERPVENGEGEVGEREQHLGALQAEALHGPAHGVGSH